MQTRLGDPEILRDLRQRRLPLASHRDNVTTKLQRECLGHDDFLPARTNPHTSEVNQTGGRPQRTARIAQQIGPLVSNISAVAPLVELPTSNPHPPLAARHVLGPYSRTPPSPRAPHLRSAATPRLRDHARPRRQPTHRPPDTHYPEHRHRTFGLLFGVPLGIVVGPVVAHVESECPPQLRHRNPVAAPN